MLKDITGQRFGKVRAVRHVETKKGHQYWLCYCDCGGQVVVRKNNLSFQGLKSCPNCRYAFNSKDKPSAKLRVRGNKAFEKLHSVWSQIKYSTHSEKSKYFEFRKAMGIKVCESWKCSFYNFFKDMGLKPDGKNFYRIALSKGYHKENCIWAKKTEIQDIRAMLR